MIIPPIDFEIRRKRKGAAQRKKRYIPKPKKKKSVFQSNIGTIELYQDCEAVRSFFYYDKKARNKAIKEWEMWIRNLYEKHTFWIHIKPKDFNAN